MEKPTQRDEKEIFHAACAIDDPRQRAQYLARACGTDLQLRRQIESLLEVFEANSGLLERNAPASELIGSTVVKLSPGATVAKYKIVRKLGEGGFGVVFLAEQKEPIRRSVALKVIKLGMDTEQVVGRFESERQALAMMDHPNISKVLDAGSTDSGRPYFVMEFVQGLPITRFCQEQGIDSQVRLGLFIDVCRAIQHAHQKGVIHRDIKPSNVLVASDENQKPVVKVIDFGIAKATQQSLTERTRFSTQGQWLGTPMYMSPEQARLSNDIDIRSDIYSLGVLLYELLTDMPPFDAEELRASGFDEIVRQICEVDPPTPSTRIKSISSQRSSGISSVVSWPSSDSRRIHGELDWITMKALEKDRTRRYDSASGLADDIRRYLSNEPVLAAAPSRLYRLRKYVGRNRGLVSTIAFAACSLLLGAIASGFMAMRAIDSEQKSRQYVYAIDMATAQRELNDLNTRRTLELIEKYKHPSGSDFRGFEWRWLWNQCHQELFELRGHTELLRDLRFSPDGKLLASASRDGTIRLWDVVKKQQIWKYQGGTHCNGVDFSPDGKFLAGGVWYEKPPPKQDSGDSVIVWDISDPTRPQKRSQFEGYFDVRFLPNGQTISCIGKHFTLDGEEVFHLSGVERGDQALSTNGELVAVLTRGRNASRAVENELTGGAVFDLNSGEMLGRLPKHSGYGDSGVQGIAFSPLRNDRIVTTAVEGVRLWDGAGNLLRQIFPSGDTLYSQASFSADGALLAVRQFHGAIQILETENWTVVARCRTASPGNTLAFSPTDQNLLVAGGDDGVIRGWRPQPTDTTLEHPQPVHTLKFSPVGKTLAVGMNDGAVWLWDILAGRVTRKFDATKTKSVSQASLSSYTGDFVVYSVDGKQLAKIGPEHVVTVWDLASDTCLATLEHPEGKAYACVALNGDVLFAGDLDPQLNSAVHVWKWQRAKPELVKTLPKFGWGVRSLAISPDGSVVASGHWHDVSIWDSRSFQLLETLPISPHEESTAYRLCFSSDGNQLAAADGQLGSIVWDTKTWRQLSNQPNITTAVDVAFTNDGSRLVVSDIHGSSKLWHLPTQQVLATYSGKTSEFSPDGTILAIASPGSHWAEDQSASGRVSLLRAPTLEYTDNGEVP